MSNEARIDLLVGRVTRVEQERDAAMKPFNERITELNREIYELRLADFLAETGLFVNMPVVITEAFRNVLRRRGNWDERQISRDYPAGRVGYIVSYDPKRRTASIGFEPDNAWTGGTGNITVSEAQEMRRAYLDAHPSMSA